MTEGLTQDKKSLKTVFGKTANFNEIAKDCVAFANARGGKLFIGIEDNDDVPPIDQIIPQELPDRIVRRVNELTINVGVHAEKHTHDNGGEYIILTILRSRSAISATSNGMYFIRDEDKSRPVQPDELERLCEFVTDNYPNISRKTIIAFGIILQHGPISASELSRQLQIPDSDRLRSYIGRLSDEGIIVSKGKGTKYYISPELISNAKSNIPTSLKTIEPYRLKALIKEDLRFHPLSMVAEISNRLPDVDFNEIKVIIRKMALDGELITEGGRKFRKYRLP